MLVIHSVNFHSLSDTLQGHKNIFYYILSIVLVHYFEHACIFVSEIVLVSETTSNCHVNYFLSNQWLLFRFGECLLPASLRLKTFYYLVFLYHLDMLFPGLFIASNPKIYLDHA